MNIKAHSDTSTTHAHVIQGMNSISKAYLHVYSTVTCLNIFQWLKVFFLYYKTTHKEIAQS